MGRKRSISLVAYLTWLLVIIFIMLVGGTLDLEIYVVLALVGLLVVVMLIDPSSLQPVYIRRMKYVSAGGILVFGYIVANRIVGLVSQ